MVIKRSTNLYCFSFNDPFQVIIIASFLMTLRNALQNVHVVLRRALDYMNYTSNYFHNIRSIKTFWNFDASFEERY